MEALLDHSPAPACPASFNLAAYVLDPSQSVPDKIALIIYQRDIPKKITYKQLATAVFGAANGLSQAGIKAGDRVMLGLGNTIEFPIAFLALAAIDAIAMPVSEQLSKPEVNTLIEQTRPNAFIAASDIDIENFSGFSINTNQLKSFYTLPPLDPVMGDPNRAAYIIFTSGTSGQPKAVVHAHRAVWARRMMWDSWYDLRQNDVMMHAGALNWTYTLGTGLMDPWAIGATAVIPNTQQPKQIWSTILETQTTIFAAAPGIFRRLLVSPPKNTPVNLRHALCAGDTLPQTSRDMWRSLTGTPICEAYGMTECSTFLSARPSAPDTLQAQTGRKIAILGQDRPVNIGELGSIAISMNDPGLMLGYLENNKINLKLTGSWFKTEDTGKVNSGGTITFSGRHTDIMNAGAYRVSPREVEIVFERHPNILEVAVTEIEVKPDVTVIAAFYISTTDIAFNELEELVQSQLARYKHPRVIQRVKALPRTPNGKLIRASLPKLWNKNYD